VKYSKTPGFKEKKGIIGGFKGINTDQSDGC
jgi:hypothetical protein